ncbi:acyl-phosphate glycerol 3-phosphate acyltransferase [Sphingobium sp. SCG-1]|uniref:glycerol-3-phosphate 1-O-acyltransferase PlsY n=1 Tax=Sphingobium sp. SCG-1 TaxID=2072936 RepID=UPI000CD6BDC5|nr:glycerol-3-phosphate 1-O-acyltransferase PlsY [Sphingobium sp. SCG-1]AUW60256.1 acyl-phosphate glycerol 3-phosphate acyltransferase [Sphingobium sp. SCG-1]
MPSSSFAPLLAVLVGYLLGSIPFGLLITRFSGEGDLRKIGSGNIGATNVLRTGRKGLAALTLVFDLAKGMAAVAIGHMIDPAHGALICGLMAFVGHCYPVWLRFAGGKGVATMMGVVLALHWPSGLLFAGVWIAALLLSRRSSVGGMSAAVSAPIGAWAMGHPMLAQAFAGMTAIVLWRHRANIARLIAGTEPKVGKKG